MKRILSINGVLSLAMVAALGPYIPQAAAAASGGDSLPQASTRRQSQNRWDRIYQKAWQDVRDNYYEPSRLNEWNRWEHAFDGKLRNRGQLLAAISSMLGSLNDDYTYVLSQKDKDEREHEASAHVVHQQMLEGGIGYIKLDNLRSDSVVREFARAMKKLSTADSYVLDLRGNHGGYITLANQLFSMLTDAGMFMSYSGRSAGSSDSEKFELSEHGWAITTNGKVKFQNRLADLSGGKPLAVLVDKDTRSAAELLSGALRENGRAKVIGERTFGKGVLQDAYDLGDQLQMKIVTARYFLPDGDSIHEKGLQPDVIATSAGGDTALERATDLLRQQLRRRQGIAGLQTGSTTRNF